MNSLCCSYQPHLFQTNVHVHAILDAAVLTMATDALVHVLLKYKNHSATCCPNVETTAGSTCFVFSSKQIATNAFTCEYLKFLQSSIDFLFQVVQKLVSISSSHYTRVARDTLRSPEEPSPGCKHAATFMLRSDSSN